MLQPKILSLSRHSSQWSNNPSSGLADGGSKVATLSVFRGVQHETLHEALKRFKDFLRLCPHHGLQKWMVVQTFHNPVTQPMRAMIDAAAGGTLMSKTEEEAYNLIEEMALNN